MMCVASYRSSTMVRLYFVTRVTVQQALGWQMHMPGLLVVWGLDTTHVGVSARLQQAVWVVERGATTAATHNASDTPCVSCVLSKAHLHARLPP
jgi:hypothetical protein